MISLQQRILQIWDASVQATAATWESQFKQSEGIGSVFFYPYHEAILESFKLLRTFMTVPVTTAQAERSFSKAHVIKTYEVACLRKDSALSWICLLSTA